MKFILEPFCIKYFPLKWSHIWENCIWKTFRLYNSFLSQILFNSTSWVYSAIYSCTKGKTKFKGVFHFYFGNSFDLKKRENLFDFKSIWIRDHVQIVFVALNSSKCILICHKIVFFFVDFFADLKKEKSFFFAE